MSRRRQAGARPPAPWLWPALLLAGCGGAPAVGTTTPDRTLEGASRTGQLALENDRAPEATRQFRAALARARERDEAGAIGDAAIGLAAALLRESKPREALALAREVAAELVRRRATPPAGLVLAEAVALYRLGDLAGTEGAAAAVVPRGAEDAEAAQRAWFMRGLAAAGRM